jgi:imidazolonepropionase-like amidohydrolase
LSRIRITRATVLDGTGHELPDHDVVIDGDVIVAVEPSSAQPPTDGDRLLDADGGFVMPGLIDAHSHLTLHTSAPERNEFHLDTPFLSARSARLNLAAGVTTCRDVGGHQHVDISLRDAVARGDIAGPRVLAAGRPIACTGGHIHYFCREADGVPEVRKAVREQIKAGADLIKIMLTGGSANVSEQPTRMQLQPDELTAAVDEAVGANRRVAVHAHTGRAIALAAGAGVHTVEHGALLDDEGIAALLDTGCALVPTQAVYRRMASNVDGWPQAKADNAARLYDRKIETLAKAIAAGVRIGVGTDSGRHFPHGGIVAEMRELVDAGMTVKRVLHAATAGNAELCGIGDRVGRVQNGMLADLLLLTDDPRLDLGVLQAPRRVVAAGRVYDEASGILGGS